MDHIPPSRRVIVLRLSRFNHRLFQLFTVVRYLFLIVVVHLSVKNSSSPLVKAESIKNTKKLTIIVTNNTTTVSFTVCSVVGQTTDCNSTLTSFKKSSALFMFAYITI